LGVRLDGRIRVYYSALDEAKRGRIGYVDLAHDDPTTVIGESLQPILDLGERGAFDEDGVNPSCVLHEGGETRMYYLGWQRGASVPYSIFLGLARSHDDGASFTRASRAPVLERTNEEPFFRSAGTVVRTENCLRCWYVSTRQWKLHEGKPMPEYVIRSAESTDGLAWRTTPGVAIDFESPAEFGFGRPWVLRDTDRYRMWYSIRSHREPYRIGYAESSDGAAWTRLDDEVGIERSATGWDSEMICFACVVDVGDCRYMFYNGNRHGATGFGVAVLDER
jgi:hypothetical protein